MNIYQDIILDHYHHPHHHGSLDSPTHHGEAKNLSCGDSLTMDVDVKNGIIEEARFRGTGCAISQASASMLLESIGGKTLDEVRSFTRNNILGLLGLELSPTRLKCALLSLETLKKAIQSPAIINKQ